MARVNTHTHTQQQQQQQQQQQHHQQQQLRVVSMMGSRSEVAMVFALHKQMTNYSFYMMSWFCLYSVQIICSLRMKMCGCLYTVPL